VQKEKKEVDVLKFRVGELEDENRKLEKLLKIQENMSADYKKMNEDLKIQIENIRIEYERKLEDEALLVDTKTDRIRSLESQLNNYTHRRCEYRTTHTLFSFFLVC
jgi:phage regulator Rha-like protein